jgi:hypothetical protein
MRAMKLIATLTQEGIQCVVWHITVRMRDESSLDGFDKTLETDRDPTTHVPSFGGKPLLHRLGGHLSADVSV